VGVLGACGGAGAGRSEGTQGRGVSVKIHLGRRRRDPYRAPLVSYAVCRRGRARAAGAWRQSVDGDIGPVWIHGLELVLASWSSTSHKISKHEG
jgi:hypothetical protein